jgi:hypothetical protein
MTVTINQNYINKFSADLYHLIGTQGSKLKGVFSEEIAKGEKHFFDRLGEFSVAERVARNAATTLQDAAHSRRMATVKLYDAAVGVDKLDINKMLIEPTNDYVKKLSNKHGQNYDVVLLNALIGSAASGASGEGTTAFDTATNQIAHGGTGLTAAKFNQALRILQSNRVDVMREEVVLICNARALEDLYAESTFTSFDFQNKKVLAGKELPSFRGVSIIHSEDVPDSTAGSVYRGIMTTRNALKVAISENLGVEIDKRPDLSNIMQVYTSMMFGAVRMEEANVVDILFQ